MKKLFVFICTLIVAVSAVTGFAVTARGETDSSQTVSTAEELKAALSNSSVSNITLAESIALNESVDISKNNLVLNGMGFTLTGASFTLDNAESLIEIDNLNFVSNGDTQNFIVVKNYTRVVLTDCTFTGAKGYALDICNQADSLKTFTLQNCTTENNGLGGIVTDGKVNLRLVGNIEHKESVINEDWVSLFEGGNQKFLGPDNELSIGIVVKEGNVNVNGLIQNKYVIKEKDGITVYAVSYDSEAPYINVASLGDTETERGKTVDFTSLKISDNRTPENKLKVYITVKDASGKSVSLQNADAVYVNGKIFTAETIGIYTVTVKAEDEYGNISAERYVYYNVISEFKSPVIQSVSISKLITVGKEVEIPAFTAIDYNGETITCTALLKNGKGEQVSVVDNKFTVAEEGVYYLIISAKDDKNQTSEMKISLNAVNEWDAEIAVDDGENKGKGCSSSINKGGTVAVFLISCIILGVKKKQSRY